MSTLVLAVLGACLAQVPSGPGPGGTPPGGAVPTVNGEGYDFSAIDGAATQYLAKTGLPGAAVMVLDGGKVVYERYYGGYDATTVVSIASASKWISGATMVALQEAGKLDLDDPVGKYISEFASDPAHARAGITLRQCFNHTSALPANLRSADSPTITMREAGAAAGKAELSGRPGSAFRYGGVSMRVAGACAEVAAGKKWRELFDDAIGKPVGMSSTRWGRLELSQNPSPAGGASSTLRDYGRFLAMVLGRGEIDGVRVLSEAGVAELLRDQTGGVPIGRASVGRRGGDGKASYGVGCWVEGKDEQGETVTASSPGAFGFVPAVNMERGVGFIWMIEDKGRNRKKAKDLPDMVKVIRETIKAQLGTEMGTTPASPDPE